MSKKRFTDEQTAFALRQADGGTAVGEICRKMGASEAMFYRWKKVYAGMGLAEIRCLKQLEDENGKLKGMDYVRGAPNHPQTQGKIERWHQTLKNRILLESHYLPGALEAAVREFVEHCNHRRVHESLGNVAPADAYFGRAEAILAERRKIKEETIRQRRLIHQSRAA